ncbi:MAG: TolC family protein [Flavobacteriales bacterium]|nr:TolC family protein [Flavobacteriales bacterium]
MRYVLIILLCLTQLDIQAQETWGLKQCIDHAYEHNLQVKQSEINTAIQQERITATKGQRLPNLNGFASHTYNFGQRIDPFTNQFANSRVRSNNFYLNSQITLFNGFQTKSNIKQSLIDYQIQEQNTEKIKNDIALAIAANYLQILFNEEAIKIAQQQMAISNQQLKRIDKLVRAGTVPQGNLLDLQAQIATDEMNLVSAENQLVISTLYLKQLLQLDNISEFRIVIPETSMDEKLLVSSTPGQVYDAALNIMPNIKTSQLQIESATAAHLSAKGRRYPSLSLSGSIGTGYSELITYQSFGEQAAGNFNQSIGFNLSIPVFNRFSTKTSIESAKLNIELSEIQLQQTENQLRNDIEQAHVDAVSAMKKYMATLKALDAQKQSFEYAKKRFEVGMLNAVDFNMSKNKLANTESQLLQSKYDYLFKIKILEFYQGKSLAF